MDVGMSIVSSLYEVQHHNPSITARQLFRSGIEIGKDMIGQNNGVAGVSAQGKITPMPSAADIGAVPTSRTINTKPLSANITLKASDVGAVDATQVNVPNGVAGIGSDGKLHQVPSAKKLSGELFIISVTQPPVQEGKIWLKPIT